MTPYVHVDTSLEGCGTGHRIPLTDDEAHHLATVLRLHRGAPLEVADGAGRCAAAELDVGMVRLVGDVTLDRRPPPRLAVAQALPKARKLDEVVRQVTELGADAVIPVAAERSVSRLGDGRDQRAVTRWRAVARSAAEQSRQPYRPTIHPVTTVGDLDAVEPTGLLLVAHPGAPPLPGLFGACRDADGVIIAVGPEGGWTDAEVDHLIGAGACAVGLGPTVLRTEHAAAAAMAVLGAGVGRW